MDSHCEVNVWAGRVAGAAQRPYQLPGRDNLVGMNFNRREVAIEILPASSSPDLDVVAIADSSPESIHLGTGHFHEP
jgi:hypothetical protein